jgi:hypothetical protein
LIAKESERIYGVVMRPFKRRQRSKNEEMIGPSSP